MRIPGQRYRLTDAHMVWMRIPDRYWTATFDGIQDAPFKEKVRGYLQNIETALDDGDGLLFWGDNSVGKSGAAAVIAMEARRHGASVLFITTQSLLSAHFDKEVFDGDLLTSERAVQVDMLVLDELGKENSSEKSSWAETMIENLLRVRASNKRATVITTNMSPAKMEARYRVSMMEVLQESFLPIHAEGENRRSGAAVALRTKYAAG